MCKRWDLPLGFLRELQYTDYRALVWGFPRDLKAKWPCLIFLVQPRFVSKRHGRRTEQPWPTKIDAGPVSQGSGKRRNGKRRLRGVGVCAHQRLGGREITGFLQGRWMVGGEGRLYSPRAAELRWPRNSIKWRMR
jgi:hypothetical protein